MDDTKNIIESLLFVADTPLTIERIKRILPDVQTGQIKAALNHLAQEYEARSGAFRLYEVAGGYQIRTLPAYHPWIRQLVQPSAMRMSKPALETLAIVAYRQPIIRSDIEHIRGVDCGGVLRMLLEKKLIRVLGRKEIPGRPLIYATSKRFLEVFGLKDLHDLPTLKEIEALDTSSSQKTEAEPSTDEPEETASGEEKTLDFKGNKPL